MTNVLFRQCNLPFLQPTDGGGKPRWGELARSGLRVLLEKLTTHKIEGGGLCAVDSTPTMRKVEENLPATNEGYGTREYW